MKIPDQKEGRFLAWLIQLGAVTAAGIGMLALYGWLAGVPFLTSFGSNIIPMAPSTALFFLIYGMLLFLHVWFPHNRMVHWIGIPIAFLGECIALLLFIFSMAGIYFKAEHLGIPINGILNGLPIGHMSPLTAFCFFLLGTSYLLPISFSPDRPKRIPVASVTAILVLSISIILTIGYLLGGPLFYGSNVIPPALTTSLAFLMLSIALLAFAGLHAWPSNRVSDESSERTAYTLFLTLLLLATGIIAIGYFYFQNYHKHFRIEAERQIAAIAELKSSELSQWRKERLGDASVFFDNENFSWLVKNYLEQPDSRNYSIRIQRWLGKVQNAYQYDRVSLYDTQGNERLAVPETAESGEVHLRDNVAEVLRSGQITFLDFHREEPNSPIHLSILVPLFDRENASQPQGVLSLRIDPAIYLYPFIARWPIPSNSAETLLIRRDGEDVLYLNELRFQKGTALTLRSPLTQNNMMAVKAALGERGVMEGEDYRGVPVMAAIQVIPDSPWILVARIDQSEVLAPLRERLWEVIGFIVALLVGAGAVTGFLWRNQRAQFYRERYRAAEALRTSEELLRSIIDNAKGMIWVKDLNGRFLILNNYVNQFIPEPKENLIGRTVYDIHPPDLADEYTANDRHVIELGQPVEFEESARYRNEQQTFLSIKFPLRNSDGQIYALGAICTDITERKKAEERILKLNRVYSVLSDINQAIVRIRDPQELFEKVCHIIVHQGGFRLAWIGLANEVTHQLQPVAMEGDSRSYFENSPQSFWNELQGDCPIVLALREGRHTICHVKEREGSTEYCHKILHDLGIQSVASFPMIVFGKVRGTINFYAAEPDIFDQEELSLLDELTKDVSFSLEFMEQDTQRRQVEEALRQREADYQLALRSAQMGDWSWDIITGEIRWSPQCKSLYGLSPEDEIDYAKFIGFIHPEDRQQTENALQKAVDCGIDYEVEKRIIWLDGSIHWHISRGQIVRDISEKPLRMIGMTIDITERKRAEEALRTSEERYRHTLDNMLEGAQIIGFDWRYLYINHMAALHGRQSQEELLGSTMMERYPGIENTEMFSDLKDCMEKRVSHIAEFEFPFSDGTSGWFQLYMQPVPEGIFILSLDISERKQSDEILRQSEERLRLALNSAKQGLYDLNIQTGVAVVSPEYAEMLGYDPNDFHETNAKWIERLHPDDYESVAGIYRAYIEGTLPDYRVEFRQKTRDGQWKWILSIGKIIEKDAEGHPLRMVGTHTDITELKNAEINLRASEERYRSLVELSPDAVFINRNNRVVFINASAVKLLGATDSEQLLGRSPFDFFDRNYHPLMQERIARLLRGETVPLIEGKIVRLDHVMVDVEVVASPFDDSEGKAIQVILRDITTRKRAEAERERLVSAIEQSAEVVVITDPQGIIQYVNPAFETVTGYTRAEALGKNPNMLSSGNQDKEFYRTMWETISRGEKWEGRFINKKKDGTYYTEEASISPVCDIHGAIINYVAVKRDITSHLRMQEEQDKLQVQLIQAQKMEAVGRLAGGVAHDFNNIIMAIHGYSELVLRHLPPDDPSRGDMQEIRVAADRAASLTRQLLAFSRRQPISPKVVDLNESVSGMLKMLQRLIGEDINLVWSPGPDIWTIQIDPSQIDQILANLAVNARDAIEGVGNLTIETANAQFDQAYCMDHVGYNPGDYVRLAVSDDGCGIDNKTINMIFEPFFTTKGKGKGTGLGLATVYGIIKQNNGFINVYSEPEKGTTFRIYLPRYNEPGVSIPSIEQEFEPLQGGTETVLLVEDEMMILNLGKKLLEGLGYKVITANTPNEAIRFMEENPASIQLLITDVVMPEMNGKQLIERLLKIKPDLKCLYMSGYTANVIAHRGILEEGVHFIQKPFSVETLATKVREALRG